MLRLAAGAANPAEAGVFDRHNPLNWGVDQGGSPPDTAGMQAPPATPAARWARARILELGYHAEADHAFLSRLSGELRTIVPFEAAFWAAVDPVTMLPTSPARLELSEVGGGERACAAYWESEFLVEDFNRFRDLARAACPVATLYRATAGHPARSTRFRAVNREAHLGDELRGVFRTGSTAWGIVSLWRGEDQQPFTPAEERVLAELSRPIAQSFQRSARLQPDHSNAAADAPGLLVFDESGKLESLNHQAETYLRDLPATSGIGNRTEVLAVAAMARAIDSGRTGGVARARFQDRAGRWLIVHAFQLRAVAGRNGATALVIEPAKASEVAPIIAEAYELTAREQQITQLIARGLSSGEIAGAIHLSPHTVRDYIKQVFEKTGVASRGELVYKIFAEHYAPALPDYLRREAEEHPSVTEPFAGAVPAPPEALGSVQPALADERLLARSSGQLG